MAFGNKSTQLVVRRGDELNDEEIDRAFAVSDSTSWYRAVVQLVDNLRQEHVRLAPTWADSNNALAMARENGAAEALSGLLIELEDRRAKNSD
jgi:hypothetical protein